MSLPKCESGMWKEENEAGPENHRRLAVRKTKRSDVTACYAVFGLMRPFP